MLNTPYKMQILDLGCGNKKYPGSFGVDIRADSEADLVFDLNFSPLPFKNDSFDYVVSNHVFEHLDDVEKVMREIHRVTKHKSRISVLLPHFSWFYSYCDPTHKRGFSVFSFDKIAPRCGFRIVFRKITFHSAIRRYMVHHLFNRFPLSYERFWAFILPAEELVFEFEVIKEKAKI
jgi:SAM-dependent methyltransferase